jgi:hypothetical protein
MKHRFLVVFALAALLSAPAWAQLAPYSQDFEVLDQADPGALAADGWRVFGNVFNPADGQIVYGYGTFPAPNGGAGFSAIDAGQGGPLQGAQQLSIYSDYNNGDHAWAIIEANVFQERWIDASNVGETWYFKFDAKRGNINDPNFPYDPDFPFPGCPCSSEAIAFIKTLNPAAGWSLSNFIIEDTTDLPDAWGTYWRSIYIDPSLVGQLLQFGFANTARWFQPSGVFYDNVSFETCDPAPLPQGDWHRQCLGVPAAEGGIDPGRFGRGPSEPTDPDFVKDYLPAVSLELEQLLYEMGGSCAAGMDADPASDPCERATKQFTALLFNRASGRVQDFCPVDLSAYGCGSTDVASLVGELAGLINSGDAANCSLAADCAAAVNEGMGVIEAAPAAPAEAEVVLETVATPTRSSGNHRPVSKAAEIAEVEPAPVVEESFTAMVMPVQQAEAEPAAELREEDRTDIHRHLSVMTSTSAPERAREVSRDALLTVLSGGHDLELRLEVARTLVSGTDPAFTDLLTAHLQDMRGEAEDLGLEDLARNAGRLLEQLQAE